MPLGTGAINLKNLPASAYEINPSKFNSLTDKNVFTDEQLSCPSFGNFLRKQLSRTGIVGLLRLTVTGSVTFTPSTSMTVEPTYKWPYGLFSSVQLSGNNQNNFISLSSYDLHSRQVQQFKSFVDSYTSAGITTSETYTAVTTVPFKLQIAIPVAQDMTTLTGALYAQTDATNLSLVLTTAVATDLFSITAGAGTITLGDGSGNAPQITLAEEVFTVPYDPANSGKLVIPDLTVLHGLVANDTAVGSSAQVQAYLVRVNAKLLRLFWSEENPGAVAPVPSADFSEMDLVYGANTMPYQFLPVDVLRVIMNEDQRNMPVDGIFVLDLLREAAGRDTIDLAGLTELRLNLKHATGYTPASGAVVHVVQEMLYS